MASRAARRFLDEIGSVWDHADCYRATAAEGLAEPDEDGLRALAEEEGEDYSEAEGEVLAAVRARAAGIGAKRV